MLLQQINQLQCLRRGIGGEACLDGQHGSGRIIFEQRGSGFNMRKGIFVARRSQVKDSQVIVRKRVRAIESQSRPQLLLCQFILLFAEIVKPEVGMRAGKLWVDTNSGLVIFIGLVHAAKFCLRDPDKVIDRGIAWLQAPRLFKLLQSRLVLLLAK